MPKSGCIPPFEHLPAARGRVPGMTCRGCRTNGHTSLDERGLIKCPLCAASRTQVGHYARAEKCHVWVAPSWQGLSSRPQGGDCRRHLKISSLGWPAAYLAGATFMGSVCAVHMTAYPGSIPGVVIDRLREVLLVLRRARLLVGCPKFRSLCPNLNFAVS
jgi:hypothetical protein